jgi:gliding motility-associated-like protein
MKRILLIALLIFVCNNLFATHIVGGSFSLKWISGSSYELTLNVMRDCNPSITTGFDNEATVGIFDKKTHQLMRTLHMSLLSKRELDFSKLGCANTVPNACTELGIYKDPITLSAAEFNNTDGYYFSYQRCCRNNIIQNIQDPGGAGIAIYMEIPSPRFIINSTPFFTANPSTYLCVGNLTKYNFGFKDDDNDELRYSMVTPLNGNLDRNNPSDFNASSGPYPTINWLGSHSDQREILGNPSLSIDKKTGELSVSPLQAGIYVAAVLVEEFRFGIKLGEVRLEIQFSVTECPQPVPQLVFKDINGQITGSTFEVEIPGKVCFDIEGTDPSDSLFMTIDNVSPDTNFSNKPTYERYTEGNKKTTTRVCWQADCSHPNTITQSYRVELKDNGCPVATRTLGFFTMKVKPMPMVNPTDILCMTLKDGQETIFYWGDSTGNNPYFSKYILYRGMNGANYVPIDSVSDKSQRMYNDKNTPGYDVINYSYFMRAKNLCGYEGPPSDTLGTFEQLKFIPDQQKLVTVSVCDKTKIKVIWQRSMERDFARYFVYKAKASDKKKNYSLVKTSSNVNDTVFVDSDVEVMTTSYCYHVVMKDTCDNYGPNGQEACSIVLKGKAAPFLNTLYWNQYNYWETGTEKYEIVVRGDKSPLPVSGFATSTDSLFKDDNLNTVSGIFTYYVVAHQKGSNNISTGGAGYSPELYEGLSYSNEVELSQLPLVFIPNVFTPNGDNLNETWDIRDLFVKDYKLVVYNKWGQLIYETSDKNEKWTGVSREGRTEQADVYIYQLVYSGYNDKSYTLRGNVTILK